MRFARLGCVNLALLSFLLLGVFTRTHGEGDGDGQEDNAGNENPVSRQETPQADVNVIDEATATYFYVKDEGKPRDKLPRRCFVLTQPGGTQFHVHYHFEAAKVAGNEISLELDYHVQEGRAGRGNIPLEMDSQRKQLQDEEGTYEFKVPKDGTYKLCASAKYTTDPEDKRGLKLALVLDDGKGDDELKKIKERYQLSELEMKLMRIRLDAKGMLREADFMKGQEKMYHKMVGTLGREVWWWPMSQVIILLVIGFYQVRHLQAFFQAKRLV